MAQSRKSLLAGAKRTGQGGKLGDTFRGNRFSDCAGRRGLHFAHQNVRVGVAGKRFGRRLTDCQYRSVRRGIASADWMRGLGFALLSTKHLSDKYLLIFQCDKEAMQSLPKVRLGLQHVPCRLPSVIKVLWLIAVSPRQILIKGGFLVKC